MFLLSLCQHRDKEPHALLCGVWNLFWATCRRGTPAGRWRTNGRLGSDLQEFPAPWRPLREVALLDHTLRVAVKGETLIALFRNAGGSAQEKEHTVRLRKTVLYIVMRPEALTREEGPKRHSGVASKLAMYFPWGKRSVKLTGAGNAKGKESMANQNRRKGLMLVPAMNVKPVFKQK